MMKGLYVPVTIAGEQLHFLVDTGATDTYISKSSYGRLQRKPSLQPATERIMLADGSHMEVDGRIHTDVTIGQGKATVTLFVADVCNDGVLGMDNLLKIGAKLNLETAVLETNWGAIKCHHEDNTRTCFRIVSDRMQTVPAGQEYIITGHIEGEIPVHTTGIVEAPNDRNQLSQTGILLARTVVRSDGGNIPIRVLNPTESQRVIKKGMELGYLTTISDKDVQESKLSYMSSNPTLPDYLLDLYHRTTAELPEEYHAAVAKLLTNYQDVFSKGDQDIGRTNVVKHHIDTGQSRPIRQRPRKSLFGQREEIRRHVQDLLGRNLIEPSDSPWAANIVLVKKKDGTQRFCVDYRQLNSVTIKDAYPLLRIDETLDALSGATWFSTLDLASGYWQVELDVDARKKSAFLADGGLYAWKVMPFGMCNAPATFERLMDQVLRGLHWETLLVYLDDVIVFAKTIDEEMERLQQVFQRLRQAGLKLKPKKCNLFKTSVAYLGHIVSSEGVSTDKEKTEAIRTWPRPNSVREVRGFLGLASYYRRFVEGFANIARPLHQLTEKGRQFEWSPECQEAFDELKKRLTSTPILAYPDVNGTFILDTDASNDGIGGVLSQVQDGQERVIAYGSRVLSKPERNYCVTRKELLAVVHYLKYFRQYLYGRHVLVRTDHGALRWLTNFHQPEGQLARWLEVISSYDIEIVHRAGRIHANADALSRRPCRQCGRDEECNLVPNPSSINATNLVNEDSKYNQRSQLEDPNIQPVLEALQGDKKPSRDETAALPFKAKVLLEHWDQLEVRDGILYRRWESADGNTTRWRFVLPRSLISDVLQDLHSSVMAGHLGMTKTLQKVQERFYWVGMKEDVRSFIRQCPNCASHKKAGPRKRAPLQQRQTGYPMERIALDIMGPLPVTEDGNKYVLVVADYFTKYVEAYAIPDERAETVARKLVEEFICRYGVPREIHSDQGRNFESTVFQQMCQLLGITKTRTTPYNPKSDGMVERFNRTLINIIATLLDPEKHQKDWDRYLPYATAAYRSSTHDTLQETPNMMMFGREVTLPVDLDFPRQEEPEWTDYAQQLRERLEATYQRAQNQQGREMRRQKRNYDRKTDGRLYEAEQFVWLRNDAKKKGVSPKLAPKWEGPYQVITRLSNVTYRIQKSPRSKMRVVHFDRLKPYNGPVPEAWRTQPAEDIATEEATTDAPGPESDNPPAQQSPEPTIIPDIPRTETSQDDTSRYPRRQRRPPDYFY